ncbi:DUF1272 domain-containing protein [Chroococcidiopsis sp. CCMEE 29]|uniref:DUF1272 domain-containing protein n=1 Tax=Chroococcidiopsis sp. CCMEE 29 TaxID=155894 RepID=UPI0031F8EA80
MLELRPNCECCNQDLPPDSKEAMICSFECTFCQRCVETILVGICPNCSGGFVSRPIRPAVELIEHPASIKRVFKQGCKRATVVST